MVRGKIGIFIFILFLESLVWKEYYAQKKKKNMLRIRVLFLKFGIFWAFFNMLATCCMLHVMSAGYPVLQNMKCTTKFCIEQIYFVWLTQHS